MNWKRNASQRPRWAQWEKQFVLLLLVSFFSLICVDVFVRAEESCQIEKQYEEEILFVDNSKANDDCTKIPSPPPTIMYSIESIEMLESFLLDDAITNANANDPLLWTFLVHKPSCASSQAFKTQLESLSLPPYVGFGMIPVQASTIPLLDMLQLASAPAIVFLKRQSDGESSHRLWSVLYQGSTVDLEEGLRHYWSRLLHSNIRQRTWSDQIFLEALTISVTSLAQLHDLIQPEHRLFPSYPIPLPLDPLLSVEEKERIQSIHQQTWTSSSFPPPTPTNQWIICRCQSSAENEESYQNKLDAVASVLSLHHEALFCILEECPISKTRSDGTEVWGNETELAAIYRRLEINEDGTTPLQWVTTIDPTKTNLAEHLARLLRPTVLWWDRQMTTPIAFAPYYTVHVVLVLDLDNTLLQQEVLLAEYGKMCQTYHFSIHSDQRKDVVCLIVPSTETRVLTTFGIDIWSGLDDLETYTSGLPAIFLTHRTETLGIQRYYFEDDPDDPHDPGSILRFVQEFFTGQLQPELHSRTHFGSTTDDSPNAYGVVEWTAYHAAFHASRRRQQKQQQRRVANLYLPPQSTPSAHTLLMIYAPTCGHCKRLSVAWNQLGKLIKHLQWNSWLQVARLDVTKEEFSAMGASLLPSVYYYFLNTTQQQSSGPIWYQRNEVGALSDPLEIVDWLLDVGVGLNETELLASLLQEELLEEEQDYPKPVAVDESLSAEIDASKLTQIEQEVSMESKEVKEVVSVEMEGSKLELKSEQTEQVHVDVKEDKPTDDRGSDYDYKLPPPQQ